MVYERFCTTCGAIRISGAKFCIKCGQGFRSGKQPEDEGLGASPFREEYLRRGNYYEILGVSNSATPEEIHSAYRKLAMRWHPDRNGGSKESEELFKLISEAYRTLSNSTSRKEYDQDISEVHGSGEPVTEEEAVQQFIEDMYVMAWEMTTRNVRWGVIARFLTEKGCPTNIAVAIAQSVEAQRKTSVREAAKAVAMKGVLWLVLGAAITGCTYAAASGGGFYIVTWGLVLYGGYHLLRGLYYLVTGDIPEGNDK